MSASTVAEHIAFLQRHYLPEDWVVMHLWSSWDVINSSDKCGFTKDWKDEDTNWVLDAMAEHAVMEPEIGISWGISDAFVEKRGAAQGYIADPDWMGED